MRVFRSLLVLGALLAPLTWAPVSAPALAQQAPADYTPLPCSGNIEVVRLSDIKPGMMLKFFEAVATQQAWYKKAGTPDQIEIKRVVERDPATKLFKISQTQAVTSHIEPASRAKDPAHDAGYDAFVALYNESATIKVEYRTCVTPP
ncbi:MAG TPA: hypothetical protein VF865_20850 [Acidobacteriaceae bacterium]